MTRALAHLAVLCAALASSPAHAFKLQALGAPPDESILGTASHQALGFLSLFTSDVHERITRQAFDAAGVKLADDVITGVRWNDNPPAVRLGPLVGGCDSECWGSMLRVDRLAWEVLTRREQSIPPMRSHFGDMQFLHAMASSSGEPATETRAKVLRWSEFAYRVARGEISARENVYGLRASSTALEPATRDWVSGLFSSPSKRLWTVQDIFLPKSGSLRLISFGAFLHTVEDSYSAAHVRRATGRTQPNGCPSYDGADAILEFHTYVGQDTEKHALCDDEPDWLRSARPASPTAVLAELVRAYEDGKDWPFVKAILEEKAFRLAPRASAARPGRCFESQLEASLQEGVHVRPTALDASCLQDARE